jgi:metallo-beta-lactamase family protein
MQIQFLGAAGTVTGSRTLVEESGLRILIDCGLFQGFKNLRLKNWNSFPCRPGEIQAVLLTHAHLDHSGYLPLLVKNGFKGPVYCTKATRDLCGLLLPDSGYLQEEEAELANRRGFSKHKPAKPLYTEADARRSLKSFEVIDWKKMYAITHHSQRMEFSFHPAGHLLGAASIVLKSGSNSIAFSGDLGRKVDPITRDPDFDLGADILVVESTYGNRAHTSAKPQDELAQVIHKTWDRGGTLLIPSFAVGRAQLILKYISELKAAQLIPNIPVYLNSPMANQANEVYCQNWKDSKLTQAELDHICKAARPVSSREDSEALVSSDQPSIIIAASGMATGGRVLHHLKSLAPDPKNTILFVGYQAGGTRGSQMLAGAREIRIHGNQVPVLAEIKEISAMSAHADANEILGWIRDAPKRPRRVLINHGEPAAADTLRQRIEQELKIEAYVPEMNEILTYENLF